ncbi:MAG: hypothetical protein KDK36_12625, partial [Leptospiraceae bacterium]|nr:hypothetical protein [Leptospiraceae bacterium]
MNLEDFKVIVSDYRSYTLVEFENIKHIDLYNANELTIAFEEGEEKGAKNWVLDMSKIQFVDS